jgi:hypothetical protein
MFMSSSYVNEPSNEIQVGDLNPPVTVKKKSIHTAEVGLYRGQDVDSKDVLD